MNLQEVCAKYFNWDDQQWAAFLSLSQEMGCAEDLRKLLEKDYASDLAALQALDPILQNHLFRAGKENPFGAAQERYQIKNKEYTPRHEAVAKALLKLGIILEKAPEELTRINAVFVLGSTVSNMAHRLEFAKDEVLLKMTDRANRPVLMGLSGERKLILAKRDDSTQEGYLGDISEESITGWRFLTEREAENTAYKKDGKATEAGAMQLLAQEILPEEWKEHWSIINAVAKPGKDRPDTEDTAYFAGLALLEKGVVITDDFNLIIVSDAAFMGQKEQVLSGLLKAGIKLRSDQVIFCGRGYSEDTLKNPKYIQIGASAISEHVHNLKLRLEYTAVYDFQHQFYPELMLKPQELETLAWCMENPVVTPSGQPMQAQDVHYEVKRALNRLSNLALLRQADYETFIRIQPELKMTQEQFKFFSEKIQALSESAYQALRAVTVISAVPLTPQSKKLAKEKLNEFPSDSVEFLTVTSKKCPEIYPVFGYLNNPGKEFVRESFSFGHLRHMLYIEGNQGMYNPLQDSCERITDLEQRKAYFNFWYLQWFINITGFIIDTTSFNPNGSLYLHANNAEALIKLYEILEKSIEDQNFIPTIVSDYLNFRAEKLGLEGEDAKLIQIAAWARIYDKQNDLFSSMMSAFHELKIPADYLPKLTGLKTRTPTYGPALFEIKKILKQQENANITPEWVFSIGLSIYLTAYKSYIQLIAEKNSFEMPPLSFRLAAKVETLQSIINNLKQFPERLHQFPCCEVALDDQTLEVMIKPYPMPSSHPFATITSHPERQGAAPSGANLEEVLKGSHL